MMTVEVVVKCHRIFNSSDKQEFILVWMEAIFNFSSHIASYRDFVANVVHLC